MLRLCDTRYDIQVRGSSFSNKILTPRSPAAPIQLPKVKVEPAAVMAEPEPEAEAASLAPQPPPPIKASQPQPPPPIMITSPAGDSMNLDDSLRCVRTPSKTCTRAVFGSHARSGDKLMHTARAGTD